MHHLRRFMVSAVLVVATLVMVGGRADAATGDPTFTGGQLVAPYSGNDSPAVASNGTESLVVYEKRAGQGGRSDIYGRLTSTDTTSIKTAFRISQGGAEDFDVDVAWSGSSWLVVWTTETGGSSTAVKARRISSSGALQGTELTIVGSGSRFDPTVAAGANGQFLVAWSDGRNVSTTHADIYARRITSSGQLLDGAGSRISYDTTDAPAFDEVPDVAWNGQMYLVVWERLDATASYTDVVAGGLRSNGIHVDVGLVAGAGSSGTRNYSVYEPAVAAGSGGVFLVVWSYEDPGFSGGRSLYGALLDGTTPQPASFPVSRAAGEQTDATVAFNGQFLVVWKDSRNGADHLWGTRIEANGTVDDPDGFLVTDYYPDNGYPALTKGSSATKTFTLAWEARPSGQQDGIIAYGVGPAPK